MQVIVSGAELLCVIVIIGSACVFMIMTVISAVYAAVFTKKVIDYLRENRYDVCRELRRDAWFGLGRWIPGRTLLRVIREAEKIEDPQIGLCGDRMRLAFRYAFASTIALAITAVLFAILGKLLR